MASSSCIKSEKTIELEKEITNLQKQIEEHENHNDLLIEMNKQYLLKIQKNQEEIKENVDKNRVIFEKIGNIQKELENHLEFENKLKKELEEKIKNEMLYNKFEISCTHNRELNLINRKTIPKTIRNNLWINTFGKDRALGECYVCEKEIHISEFEAGHIIPVSKGGSNDISNLKPVCSICNKSVKTDNLEDFKRNYLIKNNYTENLKYSGDFSSLNFNDIIEINGKEYYKDYLDIPNSLINYKWGIRSEEDKYFSYDIVTKSFIFI